MAAFTQMLSAGMFERYPRLRCVVLEAGLELDRRLARSLDHKYRVLAHQTPIRMPPSAYFYRQCLISADPDESVTAQMVERLGADYFVWASDYPHIDASFGVVRELKERLRALPERGAPKSPGPERAAVLPARGLTRSHARARKRRALDFRGVSFSEVGGSSQRDSNPCLQSATRFRQQLG